MKKYLIYIAIGVIYFTSCKKDALDVVPLNSLSDNTFWKTEKDAELALTGCYRGWESWTNITFMDGMTDLAYTQFFQYRLHANGEFSPTTNYDVWHDGFAGKWFTYSRIRKYNTFLSKIDEVEMDAETKERFKAEVRFLRCYDYFNKVNWYGDVPLVTEPGSPEEIYPRTPAAQVQQFILDELAEISTILPVQNNIASQGHITAGAALGLRARLLLYMGKYPEAMVDAKKVIDMGVYELYPDYSGVFLPEKRGSDKESVLQLNYAKNQLGAAFIPNFFSPCRDGGYTAVSATWKLVETYEMADGKLITDPDSGYDPDKPFLNRDPRLDMTLTYPGKPWNGRIYNSLERFLDDGSFNADYYADVNAARGGINVNKWIKPWPLTSLQDYDDDIPIIRLAEIYLIFAESVVESGTGDEDFALELVNLIRDRVDMPPAAALTRELVRRERAVELVFEGLRYFDIKRWDLGPTLLNGPVQCSRTGAVNDTTGEVVWGDGFLTPESWRFNPDRKYLLPIPQSEIDISGWDQNDGY